VTLFLVLSSYVSLSLAWNLYRVLAGKPIVAAKQQPTAARVSAPGSADSSGEAGLGSATPAKE
jgi:hypothetical protein